MLPSLLTRDIETGLREYLLTAYEPSDSFFRGIMQRFLDRDGSWLKGPYVQIGLPFRLGAKQRDFFAGFKTRHPGFTHQEAAWERLIALGEAANTLVATGTGSGKTECFLYPILQHCARESAAGQHGVKALIIYPMNALAADQARRIAETIHLEPAFKHIRAALYVGGATAAGGGTVMTPTGVITDRATMRSHPPDILLTNYKMLDYLLIRPKDRELWAQNGPATLRFIVVDELHTFDGAQGTDLALLLRRLKARLKVDAEGLAHIGTSATLGGSIDTAPLRDYAEKVFGAPFPPDSVITENRLDVAEFLGQEPADFLLETHPDLDRLLDAANYRTQEEAVAAWFPLFFAGEPLPDDVLDSVWRQHLGSLLKRHALFAAMLTAVESVPLPLDEVELLLSDKVPNSVRQHLAAALDALLVLVAWARSQEDHELPFATLRMQVWIREMRRLVAPLAPAAAEVELKASSDLAAETDGIFLPLIQCYACHTTGWLSRVQNLTENRLSTALEEVYNGWFRGAAETVRLYAGFDSSGAQVDGIVQYACADCGILSAYNDECKHCGGARLVKVYRTKGTIEVRRDDRIAIYHDKSCPRCGMSDTMLLVGSRSTTIGAQIVERSWSSPFNDDAKLIAFSDSVQDAAHRAGFIGARTYSHIARKAIAQSIDYLVQDSMPWSDFRHRLETLWQDIDSPLHCRHDEFVSEFIGPNMIWQRAWSDLYQDGGRLLENSPLVGRVQKRLAWQAFAEFTYAGNRGRSLERVGVATLTPTLTDIEASVNATQQALRQQFGVEASHQAVLWWIWGTVIHMRQGGAMLDPEMGNYPEDANLFLMTSSGGRGQWMPSLYRAAHPMFPSLVNQKGCESVVSSYRQTWYMRWLGATIGHDVVLLPQDILGIYRIAVSALEAAGVVKTITGRGIDSFALNPARMVLFTDPLALQTDAGARSAAAPAEIAAHLIGMPCLDATNERYTVVRKPLSAQSDRLKSGLLRRVISAEHTGLLERKERENLENRFKAKDRKPWYENLLSATPTLEMGVDIGDLSSVMLCTVPPTVASYLQRIGRAGRRDGNAHATTLADGASPHDLYFFEEPSEMIAGEVTPPGVFLQAPEVLRRQLCAFCMDDWVASYHGEEPYPDKTSRALDSIDSVDMGRFPYTYIDYIKANRPRLIEEFISLLGVYADQTVRDRLQTFIDGSDKDNSLEVRIMAALSDLAEERKKYSVRVKDLRKRIKPLKSRPPDEATKAEIAGLEREEDKFQELVADINGRELLNTLTDAGLIPNYAFPEAGVVLKSVLWRKSIADDNTTRKHVSLPAQSFERPASSALSEFAPENRFYANQRRVDIDQINMDLARLESWRLCPNCDHMQNLEMDADADTVCPRCQDPMWADTAQKRQLLRFRQAIANSNDKNSRIDDSVEEREPRFYLRQMLVDFTPDGITDAWMLKTDDLPFGFEFISSADFRDINFGEKGKNGDKFKVADIETTRPGFKLCKLCGKVQTDPKPGRREQSDDETAEQHTYDCAARGNPDPVNIIDCLYLYREFKSEALRILVPFTRLGVDDNVVQSFSAALQLGIKRRFGGQVSHLRVMVQETPDPETGTKRQYLLIYDSVPGGTGYLHQLLAHEAVTLKEVFVMALETLESCACQHDPDKDGCYRCVYQYRLGKSMERVSRRVAISVLRDLVASLDKLERTASISGISLNRALESVLERRFIESLRRMSNAGGLPAISVVQEVISGRTGYQLQVGKNIYAVELQMDLDANGGVKRASRPDFIIRPVTAGLARRPIAVFCDGWMFHRDIVRDDAAKRTAILNSGRYWVWSVVMDDVEMAVQCKPDSVLPSPYNAKVHDPDFHQPTNLRGPNISTFTRNSVAELLHWLAGPADAEDRWIENAWVASMGWLLRLVPMDQGLLAEVQGRNKELRDTLPLWLPPVPDPSIDAAIGHGAMFDVRGVYPMAVHATSNRTERIPTVVWFDDVTDSDDKDKHLQWRWWLCAANWLQFIPGTIMVTRSGVLGGDYAGLNPATTSRPAQHAPAPVDAAWNDAFEQMLASLMDETKQLAANGIAATDQVGYSIVDEQGEEVSMAELAWMEPKLAVLTTEFYCDHAEWEARGWQVIEATPGWASRAEAILKSGGGAS